MWEYRMIEIVVINSKLIKETMDEEQNFIPKEGKKGKPLPTHTNCETNRKYKGSW